MCIVLVFEFTSKSYFVSDRGEKSEGDENSGKERRGKKRARDDEVDHDTAGKALPLARDRANVIDVLTKAKVTFAMSYIVLHILSFLRALFLSQRSRRLPTSNSEMKTR